jgi:hypothetical protein
MNREQIRQQVSHEVVPSLHVPYRPWLLFGQALAKLKTDIKMPETRREPSLSPKTAGGVDRFEIQVLLNNQ